MQKSKKINILIITLFLFLLTTTFIFLLPLFKNYANAKTQYAAPDNNEIKIVNFEPSWGDVDANTNSICSISKASKETGTKMIVFPAMSLCGYMTENDASIISKTAVNINDSHISEIAKNAVELNLWIIFGAIESKDNKFYNSTFAISPEGKASVYEEITPENSLFSCGEYPVIVYTQWGPIGLTAGNDMIDSPEIDRYYAVYDNDNPNPQVHTCKMVVGCLAYNEGYDYNNDDAQATQWNLLSATLSRAEIDFPVYVVSNLCGNQNNINFPGGSHIASWGKVNDDVVPWVYAGGCQNDDRFSLYTGISQINQTYSFTLPGDYESWNDVYNNYADSDLTCDPSVLYNPALYAQLYYDLAQDQEQGITYDHKYANTTDIKVAMANTACPHWGHKKEGLDNIEKHINDAKGANIIVFPETAYCGYAYDENNFDWEDYNPLTDTTTPSDNKTEMHVATAETIPGPTTNYLLDKYAKPLNMYIVLGMSQIPDGGYIIKDGTKKVYNSLAIICPDGTIKSYQKIHYTNDEGKWCEPGNKPLLMDFNINGNTFKVGFSICRDAQFYPEVYRYYAMKGMDLLIHSSASKHNRYMRECKMGSYSCRDNVATIVCNILGDDGPKNKVTNFSGTSLISSPTFLGYTKHDFDKNYDFMGRPIEMYGTNILPVSPKGIETGTTFATGKGLNLKGCGFTTGTTNFKKYSMFYDEIAYKLNHSYIPIFKESKTVDAVSNGIDVRPNYDISKLKFEDKTFEYDGLPHNVYVEGELPLGSNVQYIGNGVIEIGEHQVWANIIDAKQYKEIPLLNAKINIVEGHKNAEDGSTIPSTSDDMYSFLMITLLIFFVTSTIFVICYCLKRKNYL